LRKQHSKIVVIIIKWFKISIPITRIKEKFNFVSQKIKLHVGCNIDETRDTYM
jgi:acyl carrier protein